MVSWPVLKNSSRSHRPNSLPSIVIIAHSGSSRPHCSQEDCVDFSIGEQYLIPITSDLCCAMRCFFSGSLEETPDE